MERINGAELLSGNRNSNSLSAPTFALFVFNVAVFCLKHVLKDFMEDELPSTWRRLTADRLQRQRAAGGSSSAAEAEGREG